MAFKYNTVMIKSINQSVISFFLLIKSKTGFQTGKGFSLTIPGVMAMNTDGILPDMNIDRKENGTGKFLNKLKPSVFVKCS